MKWSRERRKLYLGTSSVSLLHSVHHSFPWVFPETLPQFLLTLVRLQDRRVTARRRETESGRERERRVMCIFPERCQKRTEKAWLGVTRCQSGGGRQGASFSVDSALVQKRPGRLLDNKMPVRHFVGHLP